MPKLLNFYLTGTGALPYLQERGRPTINTHSTVQGALTNSTDLDRFELILPGPLCQSRINDRNGSSACTVICSYFVQSMLSSDVRLACDAVRTLMCESMIVGNRLYDKHSHSGYLAVDEVLDSVTELEVLMESEAFIRPSGLPELVNLMQQTSRTSARGRSGGVLVITPYSFGLVSDQTTFVLFDSHAHGNEGALVACVPVAQACTYLQFFSTGIMIP